MRKQTVSACPLCGWKHKADESDLWRIPAALALGPCAVEEVCRRGHRYVTVLSMRGHLSMTPEEFEPVAARLGLVKAGA